LTFTCVGYDSGNQIIGIILCHSGKCCQMYVAWKYCWVGKATHTALCGVRARLAGSLNTRLRYLVMRGIKKRRNANSRLGCSLVHSYYTAIKVKPNAAGAA